MNKLYTKTILVNIAILFAITFASASLESGYYFLLPYFDGVGVSMATAGGLVMGLCYAVAFTLRPLVPFAANIIGRERVLRLAFFSYFASAAGLALFAKSPFGAVAWRTVAGFGMAAVTIVMQSYEYQLFPDEVRGRCISLITVAYNLPSLIVVPPMEFLIRQKFYGAYILAFPVIAALGFFMTQKLPKTETDAIITTKSKESVNYFKMLRVPQAFFFVASAALFAFTDAGLLRFVQLADERGVAASYFLSVFAGTSILFRLAFGSQVDKLPRKIFAPASTIATALILVAASFAKGPGAFVTCGFLFGVAMGFGYPAFMCLTLDVGGKQNAVMTLAVLFGFVYSSQFFFSPMIIQCVLNATSSVALTYRILYGSVAAAACVILFFSPKFYRDL